ncbi:MAG: glycosyltransferase family 4 protein [Burkholderiaceae bacterium]
MRIALVVETYARDMGYVSNTLPKFLARDGAEVHVITTELSPYHQLGSADAVFGKQFAQRNHNTQGQQQSIDGYTLHTLPHRATLGYPRLVGLEQTLRAIHPDVVCIFQSTGWIPLECARYRRRLGFRLVIGSHTGKTVFSAPGSWLSVRRARSFMLRTVPGWYIASQADLCVVPTRDCAEVAADHFGIPKRKLRVMNLPVDTDYFHPNSGPLRPPSAKPSNRASLRESLGLAPDDLVCVYSGKFTAEKNALVLAHAVDLLRSEGLRVRGLFIGSGEQQSEIEASPGAIVIPFMPIRELGDYFRVADIGVWMNESISFLDGACCGLPLLLSDLVKDTSHVAEFTAVYRAGDPASLAQQIRLLADPVERLRRSQLAAKLGEQRFSGRRYAQQRMNQFRAAIDQPSLTASKGRA